ncbi:ABC1 family-domain-containing protein [Flammula alnicola]|nr:ABC1 family-domain-containing protein [Flammula alnicola]
MPPGPAYNWFCVLYSAAEILSHAARYRATQLTPKAVASYASPRKRKRTDAPFGSSVEGVIEDATTTRQTLQDAVEDKKSSVTSEPESIATKNIVFEHIRPIVGPKEVPYASEAATSSQATAIFDKRVFLQPDDILQPAKERDSQHTNSSELETTKDPLYASEPITDPNTAHDAPVEQRFADAVQTSQEQDQLPEVSTQTYPVPISRNLQSSKVPSSRIGRLFHYGGLAASLGYGAASEVLRRTGTGSQDQSSVMMTEANVKRLVSKLSQMRGAALKLGQFMSIQDTHVLPPEIDKIFRRVQDSAHYMPDWQMEQVMTTALGPSWSENFTSFDRIPFAAASIGQVHTAVLAPLASPTGGEERVAVKIQFPNIANSIESDLGYIKLLLTAGTLLPKGLFLDKTIHAMKAELADECDYVREASFLKTFGSPEYLGKDSRFKIPWVWDGSTSTVLVMERVDGVSVGEANAHNLSQKDRNDISAWIIELCLKELFEFRTMQTDPNWTNFLWNPETRQVELVDFGATRVYSKEFMDNWFSLLQAAALGDRDACIKWSLKLGYLTGEEDQVMVDAHINSMTLLATPFKAETTQPFSFGQGTQWAEITAEIRAQIPVMLQHRLTPPPKETYSLNRKLSGSFLLASRLGASIDTKAIWDKVVGNYTFG